MQKKYLTKQDYKELKKKLDYLENQKKKEVAEKLSKAASFGDLSENAAYENAKEEQAVLQREIAELQTLLGEVEIVEENNSGKVSVGSKVTIESEEGQETLEIVGISRTDVSKGKISYQSPIGKALLGKKEGDRVEVELPKGKAEYKVVKIE